ncbi:MAG TPA: BtrH N-terminal domain-containing protein [Clostridia bacterium]|nr:BtrH N-terminal domain-containing protein [Clostridia bacterium]
MGKAAIENVPRYFAPHINDCFHNGYAAILSFLNQNPDIILADYLSFMYDIKTGFIGVTFYYRHSVSVEFSEEELNTSMEFVYLPGTTVFDPETISSKDFSTKEKVNINMFIHDDAEVAYSRLKELIDGGSPVMLVVDLYYMPFHRAYQKDHGLHCIVVTGYDEEEGTFDVFDKYRLSSSDFDGKLPMSVVRDGRISDNPLSNAMAGNYKRPIRNLWMEVNVNKDFNVDESKIFKVFSESCMRMTGSKKVLGDICGLAKLEEFRNDLLKKKETIDEKTLFYFRTYLNGSFKNIARQRKRFGVFINEVSAILPQSTVKEITDLITQSSTNWDICANVAYKFGITKSLSLIDDLYSRLGNIKEIEAEITKKLSDITQK